MNRKFDGYIRSKDDPRDYRICAEAKASTKLPDKKSLAYISDIHVKNQKDTSQCVAHAAAEIAELFQYRQAKKKNAEKPYTKLDTTYIYAKGRLFDGYTGPGLEVRTALQALNAYGDCLYSELPVLVDVPDALQYETFTASDSTDFEIAGYARLYDDTDIKVALVHHMPVIAAWAGADELVCNDKGIATLGTNPNAGHCMMIFGYTPTGWRVRNSWGKSWGKSGNCTIPYKYVPTEAWSVTDDLTKMGPVISKN